MMTMKGKTVVVTGAHAGIGFETALALAQLGAEVIVVARSSEKAEAAAALIRTRTQSSIVSGVAIDLGSPSSIRRGSREILQRYRPIDVLIHNAGTWLSKLTLNEASIEMQMAVHHFAPFLMTHLLLPALNQSSDPRVINVNSDSHFRGRLHFNDLNLTGNYHGLRAYAQSKLANVHFTYEFERRNDSKKISIHALQPGLVKTDIGLKHTNPLHALAWKIRRMGGVTAAEGASTSIYLASSDACKDMSSLYWDRCKPKPSSKESYNTDDATRLWEITERLCGISDYFNSR